MCFLRYQILRREGFYYKTVWEGTLEDYTAKALRERVPNSTAGGFYYKTVRGYFTRLRGGGPGWGFESCGWRKWGLLPPHSLTTRLHGGEAKQQTPRMPAAVLLHNLQVTRSSYSVESAMEVLLQDLRGAHAHATKLYADFLLFSTTRLHGGATNHMTKAAAFF